MFKTVSISIGGMLFVIEEEAYRTLEKYLQSIRAHFAKSGDADEIVQDIEARAAEEFSAKISAKKKTIEQKDVDDFIKTMGTVEDFQKFDAEEKEEGRDTKNDAAFDWSNIRLYRNPDDKILGGVASGIANYFGIDPLIVRLLFVASLFMGGFGVVAYILMWILVPEAHTAAQKVEMTGGRVTLSSIQEKIDQAIPPEKRKTAMRSVSGVIRTLVEGIGRILKAIFPLIGRLIGLVLIVAAAFGIAMLTLTALSLLLNPTSPYIGFPLYETIGGVAYSILLISGYAVALMPLIFILLLASSLVTMRVVFSGAAVIALVGTWFMMLIAAGVTAFSVGPQLEAAMEQYDEQFHQMTTQKFDVEDFESIAIYGRIHLELVQGSKTAVEVESSSGTLAALKPIVKEGVLTLESQGQEHDKCLFLCKRSPITLRVTTPTAPSIRMTSISTLNMEGFQGGTWNLDLSDRTFAEVSGKADAVTANLTGASHIHFTGSSATLTASAHGASTIDAGDFTVQNVNIELSGASHASIDVRKELNAHTSGASSIIYKQEPQKKTVESSGHSYVGQNEEDAFRPPFAPHTPNAPFPDDSDANEEW
jgi:phage shock protein PspC (stress-responsive transcriptional regulator)